MPNMVNMSEEKSPEGPHALVIIGDFTRMQEAAKTNPHLAELIKDLTPGDNEDILQHIKAGSAGQVGPAKTTASADWTVALKFEEGKGERGIHGEVDMLMLGAGDRSYSTPVLTFMRSTTAEPKHAPPPRTYIHDLGDMSAAWIKALSLDEDKPKGAKEPGNVPTEARGQDNDGKASGNISGTGQGGGGKPDGTSAKFSKIDPSEEESWLQAMVKSGVASMGLEEADTKDVRTKGAMTTAEMLKKAIDEDTIPTHALTREHFGFSKCNDINEEVRLCGLYTGLLSRVYLDVPPKMVHEWQMNNKLAAGILKAYKGQQSGYLKWFKKNLHLVNADYVRPGGVKAPPRHGDRISEDFWKH